MEKKLVEILGLKEMDNTFKEQRRFTYEETNEYLLREYGCDLEHYINRLLHQLWDEMYWGIDFGEEEGEEDE